MYFHPKFIRGDVDGLAQMRKRTSAASDKKTKEASILSRQKHDKNSSPLTPSIAIRTVSPIMLSHIPRADICFQQLSTARYDGAPEKRFIHKLHCTSALMPVQTIPSASISNEEEASLVSASSSDNDSIATMASSSNHGYNPDDYRAPFPNLTPVRNPRTRRLDLLAEAMRMVI